jgi:hypothetical protein
VVTRAIAATASTSGLGAAKSAKACLSGMFGLAILDGAISANPVRDSVTKISSARRSPRALTTDEVTTLVRWLRSNDRAVALDLPDLSTGCSQPARGSARRSPFGMTPTAAGVRCSISMSAHGGSTRPAMGEVDERRCRARAQDPSIWCLKLRVTTHADGSFWSGTWPRASRRCVGVFGSPAHRNSLGSTGRRRGVRTLAPTTAAMSVTIETPHKSNARTVSR